MSDGPNTPGGSDGSRNPPPPPGSTPPASPQVPATGSRSGRPADLGPRFLARLIDFILLAVAYAIIAVPFGVAALFGMDGGIGSSWAADTISALLSTALTLGYFALMESNRGQTVGKMLMNLRVTGPGGGNPTLEESLRRNAWLALSLLGIIPVIGWLAGPAQLAVVVFIAVTISNTPSRQGWHDGFAGGTWVVRTS